jgi:glutathione synthase/RimK-type ligase-like ATP-grasp enzyme
VVAVTHRQDVSADLLMLAAADRGVDVYRFNTEDYPASIGVVADPGRPESARLVTDNHVIALGMARGIWIRRPRWPAISPAVTDPLDRQFAQQEAVAAIGGIWRLLGDRCVSPPDAMQASRWKVAQLRTAQTAGLSVPETLVTNDLSSAQAFRSGGPTIAKAVAEARVDGVQESRVGQTEEIDLADPFDGIAATPVLLQRRIDKVADLRVTAVGRRLFAVRIVTPAGAPIDFRTSPTAPTP